MVDDRCTEDLDDWERPERRAQLDMFAEPRDRILALAGVSIEEMERWRAFGWISFDVRDVPSLDEGRWSEMCFVRNIARSGLSDIQISCFLEELDPPYSYDALRTAYSFAYGWVQLPIMPTDDQKDAYLQKHLSSWIQRQVLHGEYRMLTGVYSEIMVSVARARAAGREDNESE